MSLKYNVGSLLAGRRSLKEFTCWETVLVFQIFYLGQNLLILLFHLQYPFFYTRAAQNTSSNYSAEYEYPPDYFAVAEADAE